MLVTGVLAVIRNDGRPAGAGSMWPMVGGLLLNIVMDYVFIFPLGGGVAGAAYATVADDCCNRTKYSSIFTRNGLV